MNKFFRCVTLFSLVLTTATITPTPINNVYESAPIYTPMGNDTFYTKRSMLEASVSISPYYLHAASTKNGSHKKVPSGERLGAWNMFGIFYDFDTMTQGLAVGKINTLKNLRAVLAASNLTGGVFQGVNFVDDTSESSPLVYPDTENPLFTVGGTSLSTTTTTMIGSFSELPVQYEKFGMRGQASVDCGLGCGVIVKGGIADCRATPTFKFNSSYLAYVTGTPDAATPDQSIRLTYDTLLSSSARNVIAPALGVDLSEYRKTGLEDTHVEVYWNHAFNLKDNEGDSALAMIPRFSVGAWLPTAPAVHVDKIFAAPMGNDGFFAWTVDGSLSFDFPQSIQVSVGGGAVLAESKSVWQRMPNNINQSGFYPWKTRVHKQPGTTWYANASFKAENFIDGLSCYFDYIFTEHVKDSLELEEANSAKAACFQSALQKAIDESAWRDQQWNAGLNYKVTDMLAFGCAVQSHITGVRVWRPTMLMGSMTLSF